MRLVFPALLLVLLPFARDVAAQITVDRGFKVGVNATTIRVDEDEARIAPHSRTGFVAGVFAEFEFLGPITLHPEALLSQRGTQAELMGQDDFARLSAIYFEVPALVRLGLPTALTPYVEAGPAFAIKVTERARPRDNLRAGTLFRRSDPRPGRGGGAGRPLRGPEPLAGRPPYERPQQRDGGEPPRLGRPVEEPRPLVHCRHRAFDAAHGRQ